MQFNYSVNLKGGSKIRFNAKLILTSLKKIEQGINKGQKPYGVIEQSTLGGFNGYIEHPNGDKSLFTDTLGLMPLYYNSVGEFSDDIAALKNRTLNEFYLSQVCRNGYPLSNDTPYLDVFRVLPWEYVTLYANGYDAMRKTHTRVGDIPRVDVNDSIRQRIFNLIDMSVAAYKNFYKDAAILLSGGLDSSIIFYHLKNQGINLKAYCLEGNGEDLEYAKILDSNINVIKDDPSFSALDAARIVGLPQDVGNLRGHALITKSVPESIIVTGDGPDEIFGGYKAQTEADCGVIDTYGCLAFNENPRTAQLAKYYKKTYINPFQNSLIAELGLSLPWEYRINKRILREIYRGKLPDALIDRPKKGLRTVEHTNNSRVERGKLISEWREFISKK